MSIGLAFAFSCFPHAHAKSRGNAKSFGMLVLGYVRMRHSATSVWGLKLLVSYWCKLPAYAALVMGYVREVMVELCCLGADAFVRCAPALLAALLVCLTSCFTYFTYFGWCWGTCARSARAVLCVCVCGERERERASERERERERELRGR